MYIPPKFALSDADTRAALARGGFAHLVTHTAGDLHVTPLPLLYDADRHSLIGHVARANPHWKATGDTSDTSVAIFAGPHAYISPGWYATKQEAGKVVPTWNYEVLVVHGTLHAHDDPEWLSDLVTKLTEEHEQNRAEPWRVTDAPEAFVRGQLKAIVGIELAITTVEGKTKMSQNQPERNREGVVAGLRQSAQPGDHAVAARVADLGSAATGRD
jgi:transcriptional regulator